MNEMFQRLSTRVVSFRRRDVSSGVDILPNVVASRAKAQCSYFSTILNTHRKRLNN